ncbi:MAG: pyrroloquinoline quinone biosynthesis protein PqqB [Xanthobacteraceae bacterium]
MTAIVLGSAAGGGYPQWNCRCPVCRLAWEGDRRVKARTQASVAVSADGEAWILLNASPDLRAQIAATPALRPATGTRGSPIAAVLLTGAEIDQIAGLLTLRERQGFALLGTAETLALIAENPIFAVLAPDLVRRHAVALDEPFALPGGIEARLFAVPGKMPLYREGESPPTAVEAEVNVGVELRLGGARLAYVPGAAAVPPSLKERLAHADVVLFDGTLFVDDEMIRSGTGEKTGRRMGHMPIDGPDGSLAALADLEARRVYIHVNNTNPILVDGSPERRRVVAAGWAVAEDGMEIAV